MTTAWSWKHANVVRRITAHTTDAYVTYASEQRMVTHVHVEKMFSGPRYNQRTQLDIRAWVQLCAPEGQVERSRPTLNIPIEKLDGMPSWLTRLIEEAEFGA